MDDGEDEVDLLAAEAGDVVAMDTIGISLFNQGRTDEGERWLTKAAESGSEAAMAHLGIVLMRTGDIEGAEHGWVYPLPRETQMPRTTSRHPEES